MAGCALMSARYPIPVTLYSDDNYVHASFESTHAASMEPRVTVSLARIAMIEHNDPRDAPRVVPIIRGIMVIDGHDQWGNYVFADIEYSENGWVATYGGRMDDAGRIVWQCYMD